MDSSFVSRHYRRNRILGILNGGFLGFVDSAVSPYLVLSVFLHTLGAPNFLIGSLPAIYNGGWYLPQFLISHRLQRLPRKMPIYTGAAIVRGIAWVAIILAIFLIGQANPSLMLAVFFFFYIIYSFGAGFAGMPFMDIVGRAIPAQRRGSFFGARDLVSAVMAIVAGYFIERLLNPEIAPPFPYNFGVIFIIASIAIALGLGAFALVLEPPEQSNTAVTTFGEQARAAWQIVRRDDPYRQFLFTRIMLAIADIATPFYAIYATTVLHIPIETVGVYISISTVSGLIANPLWSRASDRRGNRIVIIGAATCLLALPILALGFGLFADSAALALPFGVLYLMSGIARPAANIAYPSYLLDLAPAADRPLYISFTNTILGIATFIPIVGGVLLDLFGFQFVFVLALIISLIAWWLARGLSEPRKIKINPGV